MDEYFGGQPREITGADFTSAQRRIDNARELKLPDVEAEALRTKALLIIADNMRRMVMNGLGIEDISAERRGR